MSFRLQRTRIGVLRGGPSDEYYVSLKTGAEILKILRESFPEKYEPFDILIDMKGIWHMNGLPRKPEDIVTKMDLIINALHGPFGEGGYVSRILDSLKVPHTGPSTFAGTLSQNKHTAKGFLKNEEIKMPHHVMIKRDDFESEKRPEIISETFRSVPMPAIVKPADNGSSFGVFTARTPNELNESLEKSFAFSDKALVEEYIPGVEVTCGVIRGFRNEPLYALMPTEIVHSGILTFDDKHTKKVESRVPARISQKMKEMIANTAKRVHDKLNLGPYSRSDFIVHPKRGVMFLEVNSLPALHKESFFNDGLNATGITPEQFLEHIILISLE
ncbi:MAG: ATP-grasp domain-containing protein [Minisyncoccia bacterium]